ncbi:hypothetical protein [Micromonospora sp.]|uniref:hypothetical protein n=1 Tax=Micromonospora sp. TaxID=1876 RepID=UPI003B3ADBCC
MPKLFGKAGKAGKEQRPQQVPAGSGGRSSGGNVIPGPAVAYGPQPVAVSLAARLGVATLLPLFSARFLPQDSGAATRRGIDGGTPDFGALQGFRGLVAGPRSARLGAQAGPSDQPGYPGTGNALVLQGLANMARPDQQRYGGLR